MFSNISGWGAPPSTFSSTPALSPSDFVCRFPDWQPAVEAACTSVVSLQAGGRYQGGGVVVGPGIVLVPLHLLISSFSQPIGGNQLTSLINNLQITSTQQNLDSRFCYMPLCFPVYGVFEQFPEQDFCLLSTSAQCLQSPSIAYSTPEHCLFAQIDAEGGLALSIVQSCPNNFWQEGYCSYAQTNYGSSGGCYFDSSGALVAVHLSRSKGTCGFDTGDERRGILAKDMVRCSEILCGLQHFCLTLPPPAICSVLHPPEANHVCYENEKSAVSGILRAGNMSCQFFEVRHGKQRAIKFIIRHNGQPHLVTSSQYDLRCANGKYMLNVHDSGVYSNHESSFYNEVASMCFQLYRENGEIPARFTVTYRKTLFVAIQDFRS